MSSRYYGILQMFLATFLMAAWILDKVLFTTGLGSLQYYLRKQELNCFAR